MTAAVSLRAITDANRTAILALQVAPHQQKWIASNEISLLQAVEYSQVSPEHFAIYADETPVGFVMIGCTPLHEGGRPDWHVWRLMIDADQQRRGYGRAAMQQLIDWVRSKPECCELRISFGPDNEPARALYTNLGFIDNGEIFEGEVLLRLKIRDEAI